MFLWSGCLLNECSAWKNAHTMQMECEHYTNWTEMQQAFNGNFFVTATIANFCKAVWWQWFGLCWSKYYYQTSMAMPLPPHYFNWLATTLNMFTLWDLCHWHFLLPPQCPQRRRDVCCKPLTLLWTSSDCLWWQWRASYLSTHEGKGYQKIINMQSTYKFEYKN